MTIAMRPRAAKTPNIRDAAVRLASDVRAGLGLSQERMAILLGVSFATVNRWESGRSAPSGLHLEVYLALDVLLSRRPSLSKALLGGSFVTRRIFLQRLFFLTYGPGQKLRGAYDRGAADAAELADGYNGSTTHGHRLGDCILAKMNLRRHAPRRNATKIDAPEDTWMRGFATGLVEMHGRLAQGADAAGIVSACRAASVNLSDLRRAGVPSADLARLRRAGVPAGVRQGRPRR